MGKKLKFAIIFIISIICFVAVIYAQNYDFKAYEDENKPTKSKSAKQGIEIYKGGVRYDPEEGKKLKPVFNVETVNLAPKNKIDTKQLLENVAKYLNKEQLDILEKALNAQPPTKSNNIDSWTQVNAESGPKTPNKNLK